MRITGGLARGIVLDVPKRGEVRPATDFIRERIFNRLSITLKEACVLDCCAGTGAYGLEALSRGSQHACFLEKDPQVIAGLRNNCAKVCKSLQRDVSSTVEIFPADVFCFDFTRLPLPINYIFFDPPYRFWEKYPEQISEFLGNLAQCFAESRLVVEYPSQFIWSESLPWQPIYPTGTRKKMNAPEINVFQKR